MGIKSISLFLFFAMPASGQTCQTGFPDNLNGPSQHSRMLKGQLVMPQYSFDCNATIVRWEALFHVPGNRPLQQQMLVALDFQVWRQDGERSEKYLMVGRNSAYQQGTTIQWNQGKLVMDPQSLISVSPGDIVGVFFLVEGHVELSFRRTSRMIRTFQADLDNSSSPLVEGSSINLNVNPAFRTMNVSPLIRVQTDTSKTQGKLEH